MFFSGLFILIANSLDAAEHEIFKDNSLGSKVFSMPQQRDQDDDRQFPSFIFTPPDKSAAIPRYSRISLPTDGAPPAQLPRLEVKKATKENQSAGLSFAQQREMFDGLNRRIDQPSIPELPPYLDAATSLPFLPGLESIIDGPNPQDSTNLPVDPHLREAEVDIDRFFGNIPNLAVSNQSESFQPSQAQGPVEQTISNPQALQTVSGSAITSSTPPSSSKSFGDFQQTVDSAKDGIGEQSLSKLNKKDKNFYDQYLKKISLPDASEIKKKLMDNFTRENDQYSCILCKQKYPLDKERTSLARHLRIRHQQQWSCHVCGETLIEKYQAKRHLKSFHPEKLRDLQASQAQIPTEQAVSAAQALATVSGGAITSSTTASSSLPQPNNPQNIPLPAPMLSNQASGFQGDGFTLEDLALLAQIEQEQNLALQAVSATQALQPVSGGPVSSAIIP